MADENEKTLDNQVEQAPVDDWAAAFAALDNKNKEDAEAASDTAINGGDDSDTEAAGQGEGPIGDEGDDSTQPKEIAGGPGDLGGTDGREDEDLDWIGVDLSEEQIRQEREETVERIKQRTIKDVADAYIKQGVRHVNGRLGANINDPDICKRDQDGVPRFYNPETGREFTGDNPRRQAQEWVDDYNREVSDAFNKTCREYSQKLLQEEEGRLAIIEFAPKYKQLDPVRRSMFESIIEDYEINDEEGNIVAYSCDLDKALAAVNRQVKVIQERFAKKAAPAKSAAPSGPALDTPSTSTNAQQSGKPQFKSIEEAMEWEQDQLLAKMKGSAR